MDDSLSAGSAGPLQPAVRVLLMPKDTNALGTIFGGIILSYIDQAGAVEGHRHIPLPGRLVTVAVGPAGATEQVTGRVTAVDGSGVTLAVDARGKPGAKKRPPTPRHVPWTHLGAGRVQVEFGRHGEADAGAEHGDDGTAEETAGGIAGGGE